MGRKEEGRCTAAEWSALIRGGPAGGFGSLWAESTVFHCLASFPALEVPPYAAATSNSIKARFTGEDP